MLFLLTLPSRCWNKTSETPLNELDNRVEDQLNWYFHQTFPTVNGVFQLSWGLFKFFIKKNLPEIYVIENLYDSHAFKNMFLIKMFCINFTFFVRGVHVWCSSFSHSIVRIFVSSFVGGRVCAFGFCGFQLWGVSLWLF